MIQKANFNGDPNLGLLGIATDKNCFAGVKDKKIKETLKVKTINTTIAGSEILGIFAAANSKGIVLPKVTEEEEIEFSKKKTGLNVYVSDTNRTALGNLILVNDKGCVISPELKNIKNDLEECFGVRVGTGTIAGLNIVGSVAAANNKGVLVHKNCSREELENIERILGVEGDIGTVNFGSPFIGASILTNSNGVLVSEETTGPEMGRIDEVLV